VTPEELEQYLYLLPPEKRDEVQKRLHERAKPSSPEAGAATSSPSEATSSPSEVSRETPEQIRLRLAPGRPIPEERPAPETADAIRERHLRGVPDPAWATPYEREGEQELRHLRQPPLQHVSGETKVSPERVINDLAMNYLQDALDREPDPRSVPADRYAALREEAYDRARREVSGVVGVDPGRQNLLMPLYSGSFGEQEAAEQRKQVALGQTTLGYLAGPGIISRALQSMGVDDETIQDSPLFRALAPAVAITTPGYTAHDLTDPYGKQIGTIREREGKFSWMTRLAPSTVLATYFFDPELDWTDWGSDKHLQNIQQGKDLTSYFQEIKDLAWPPRPVRRWRPPPRPSWSSRISSRSPPSASDPSTAPSRRRSCCSPRTRGSSSPRVSPSRRRSRQPARPERRPKRRWRASPWPAGRSSRPSVTRSARSSSPRWQPRA